MSYATWHIYGYGIRVSDIEVESTEQIQALLHMAPEYEKKVRQWLEKENIEYPTIQDCEESDQDFCLGLATILKEVIEEVEQIPFTACDDYDDGDYLLYEPSYPWYRGQSEQDLTEEKIHGILSKYVSILTDKPITIDYYSVENGG